MPALLTVATFNAANSSFEPDNLIVASSGDLFGSTLFGPNGGGVTELAFANGAYGPPTQLINLGSDNGGVQGAPVMDAAGDLFLLSDNAPADPKGIIFELQRTDAGYASALTTIALLGPTANFVASYPELSIDAKGDLFGQTLDNTIYEVVNTPSGYASTATTLATVNGSLGLTPLVVDAAGNLFGSAAPSSPGGSGFVFEVANGPTGYASAATVLASFPAGASIVAGTPLSKDAAGDLFGAVNLGGGGGSIFEIVKTASGYASTPAILTTLSAGESLDNGPLVIDTASDIFAAALTSPTDPGSILELLHTATGYASTPTTLVSFAGTGESNPSDLVDNAQGNLLGLASGGTANGGTIFEYAFNAPSTVTLGAGSSTLALTLSERGEPAGAQFTISVDGTQIGGVQTTTADITQGQLQTFNVSGNLANGTNTVTIDYLNAANSLLEVNSAALDGVPVATNGLVLSNTGAAGFGFIATGGQTPVTVGNGPDVLALTVAERGEPAGARFTINVNGTQIGGVQTTSADLAAGQNQEFDVEGNFRPLGTPELPILISYLNANNSVLAVENATINGSAIPNSATTITNNGTVMLEFAAPPATGPTPIGTGPDVLPLSVAEAGEPTGAQFTISVNGAQIGGVQTTAATTASAASPNFDVLGNFLPGQNTVSIDYLNASNSLLTVAPGEVNGSTPAPITLDNIGAQSFTFSEPAAPTAGATVIGNGSDVLALAIAQAYQPTGANFTINIDGTQIGGVQTTIADHAAGQSQVFDVLGNFASGAHTLVLNYLNASNSLLFASATAIDGAAISGASTVLSNVGSAQFGFVTPPGHST